MVLMLSLIPKLPFYWPFRRFGWPRMLPFSLVVSASFRCNSRCKTCGVWSKPGDEMTLEEWDRVFAKLGRGPVYLTFTGGEPFLRKDLADMVLSAYRHCRPSVVTIPTNGLLTQRIADQVERMAAGAPGASIFINHTPNTDIYKLSQHRHLPISSLFCPKTWQALK